MNAFYLISEALPQHEPDKDVKVIVYSCGELFRAKFNNIQGFHSVFTCISCSGGAGDTDHILAWTYDNIPEWEPESGKISYQKWENIEYGGAVRNWRDLPRIPRLPRP